jgi:hypothetical protein
MGKSGERMNKITIENYYFSQKVNILINDEKISQYSKLASITNTDLYHYVSNIISYLDCEVFDTYEVDFYGYQFMYDIICGYAQQSEYCVGIKLYPMDLIDSSDNIAKVLKQIANNHGIEFNNKLNFSLYCGLNNIELEEKNYMEIVDSLPADVALLNDTNEAEQYKFCIKIGNQTTMENANQITSLPQSVSEILEYYYLHTIYIPNLDENITILKYQNLFEKESVLLNAVQRNQAAYYLEELPCALEIGEEITIDFVSFPVEAFHLAISDREKLKLEDNKGKALSGGNVDVIVLGKDNYKCESHCINIIEHQYATKISVIPNFDYLKVNEKNFVDVLVEPLNAEDQNELLYEVSDSNIFQYKDGKIIALNAGMATLTVKGKQCEGILNIYVKDVISQVVLEPTHIVMKSGSTIILQCKVIPENAETEHLIWEIDNKNIAAINPSRDRMKCQINASSSFTGKGNIRCYDSTTKIGAICNFEVVSRIKHTWVGTLALLCILAGFFYPLFSGISIGLCIYGLVQDKEISHRTRYITCIVIGILTILIWTGMQ